MSKGEVSELLKPRYKVIADYPDSDFDVGEILTQQDATTLKDSYGNYVSASLVIRYPHLFKPLAWYEDREESEMPEYMKYWDISLYFPKDIVCKASEAPFNAAGFTADNFQPATETEYQLYLCKQEQEETERIQKQCYRTPGK